MKNNKYFPLIFFTIFWSLLDCFSTYLFICFDIKELNPILSYIFINYGLIYGLIFKMILTLIVIYGFIYYIEHNIYKNISEYIFVFMSYYFAVITFINCIGILGIIYTQ